ncbi:protein kinase [Streptomyces polyrhachis]|uniref:non-specific serine/threonine protein kinase n=1 Tax=Streptomyces polyrhachis TaxID=1282885 RepID=A0ABW2GLC8_9ACTN
MGGDRRGGELAGSGAQALTEGDPRRIGEISLLGRLGAGGMGVVYLGMLGGRYTAVKRMRASAVSEDQDFVRRFGQELDNLARLPAEATAPLLAADRAAAPPWFATAYVPGITLAQAVEGGEGGAGAGGPMPAEALWALLRATAAALRPVAGQGMVHRDLKPSNVMLTLDGVALIDFGIARAVEQTNLTQTGVIVGTPAYMSPEQATGSRKLSAASDVFTLGLLLGYAAGGRWPYGGDDQGSPLYRIVHAEADLAPVRERDPQLAEVVASCLAKDPDARPTAAELAELAARHVRPGPPAWPGPVLAVLAERAAFAGRGPEAVAAQASAARGAGSGEAAGKSGPDSGELVAAGTRTRTERPLRRRTRILLAVVPVIAVAAGTTLAVQLLPSLSPGGGSQGAASSAAPRGAGPGAGGGPGAPDPGAKTPDASPEGEGKEKAGDGGEEDGKGAGKDADGPGAGASADTDTGGTTAGGSTSGGADSGGSTSTGSTSGDSASGTSDGSTSGSTASGSTSGGSTSGGSQPAPAPAPATFRLRNAQNGQCLTDGFGAPGYGSCSGERSVWKTVSSGGALKVVSKTNGTCLDAAILGQTVFMGSCSSGSGVLWNWGSGSTLRGVAAGGCLDLHSAGNATAVTACSGAASQRWSKI